MDYAYTLHGWLKAVNSSSLDHRKDIGQDGNAQETTNPTVARDVFGFSLHYYANDYKPIDDNHLSPSNDYYFLRTESSSGGFSHSVRDLYNGNISRMVTSLAKISNPTVGRSYEYDQLNRISKAHTYFANQSNNSWDGIASSSDFYSAYSYDANGNILTLERKAGNGVLMDDLSYNYIEGTNQLEYVDDQVADGSFSQDIDDQNVENYSYDRIGNLIVDNSEEIANIEWNVYGKIKRITRLGTAVSPRVASKLKYQTLYSGLAYDAVDDELEVVGPDTYSNRAKSTQVIEGDGAVEFTIVHSMFTDRNIKVGLSYTSNVTTTTDYSWSINNSTTVELYNSSTLEETLSNIVNVGDVLKVERKGSSILWYVNGGNPVLQLQETNPGQDLQVAVGLYWTGTRVSKLRIYGAKDTTLGISSKPNLEFEYSPDGHRTAKHVIDSLGKKKSTYYVRDASGNILATYKSYSTIPGGLSSIDAMDVYNYIDTTKTFSEMLDFLSTEVDWETKLRSTFLDSVEAEISASYNELTFLNNFPAIDYLQDPTIFNYIYTNQVANIEIITALNAAGQDDSWIFNQLCSSPCFSDLLTAMMLNDYNSFLVNLQASPGGPMYFDHIVMTLGLNPGDPVPVLISQIMIMSTEQNTASILAQIGHDCWVYEIIYGALVTPNTPASTALLGSVVGFKTCLRNSMPDDQMLIAALYAYFGNSTMWSMIDDTQLHSLGYYISQSRQTYTETFVLKSMELFSSSAWVEQGVRGIADKDVNTWLQHVYYFFGEQYYDQLLIDLLVTSPSDWEFALNEHHIYGSSRLGIVEHNNILAENDVIFNRKVRFLDIEPEASSQLRLDQSNYDFNDTRIILNSDGKIASSFTGWITGGDVGEATTKDCKVSSQTGTSDSLEKYIIGLSYSDYSGSINDPDYAIYVNSDGNYQYKIYGAGSYVSTSVPRLEDDRIEVSREAGQIKYSVIRRSGAIEQIHQVAENSSSADMRGAFAVYYANQSEDIQFYTASALTYNTSRRSEPIRTMYRGQKRYELSNHLGNVLAVITDRRIQACGAGDVMYYNAQVVSVSDYYPFGMGIKEREWSDSTFNYRFAFNGMEQDNEVKGQGNSYDFGARIYDSRLGRWMSIDPLASKFAYESNYVFVTDNPLIYKDADGNEKIVVIGEQHEEGSGNKLMFAHQAITQLKEYAGSEETRTIVLFNSNNTYTADQVAAITLSANNNGATLVTVESESEFADYINKQKVPCTEASASARSEDPVSSVDVFSHGTVGDYGSAFSFGYGGANKDALRFDKSDIAKLDKQAFTQNAVLNSYACRTAAGVDLGKQIYMGDGSENAIGAQNQINMTKQSLAQAFADGLDITVNAYATRTEYSGTLGSKYDRIKYKFGYASDSFLESVARRVIIDGATWDSEGAVHSVKSGSTPQPADGRVFQFKKGKDATYKN
ncbi:MAG: RHS repeat-associated protein [Bacteroidia bacterium]|jgi:RHS repeat-associated protein